MQDMHAQEEDALDTEQAAEFLGVKPGTIHQLKHDGHITGFKRGKLCYFLREELEAYRRGETQKKPAAPKPFKERYAIERQADTTPRKMPPCYRCGRQFIKTQEYTIRVFEDENGEPLWKPVCRDGRCDPTIQNFRAAYQEQLVLKREQKRSTKLLHALKEVRRQLDSIIAEYEETPGS